MSKQTQLAHHKLLTQEDKRDLRSVRSALEEHVIADQKCI